MLEEMGALSGLDGVWSIMLEEMDAPKGLKRIVSTCRKHVETIFFRLHGDETTILTSRVPKSFETVLSRCVGNP